MDVIVQPSCDDVFFYELLRLSYPADIAVHVSKPRVLLNHRRSSSPRPIRLVCRLFQLVDIHGRPHAPQPITAPIPTVQKL